MPMEYMNEEARRRATGDKSAPCSSRCSAAIELIAAERERQISVEGWTTEHDDRHKSGELGDAAACYAMSERHRGRVIWDTSIRRLFWPWDASWWKPTESAVENNGNRIRDLVKAGALIVAEIERLQRQG